MTNDNSVVIISDLLDECYKKIVTPEQLTNDNFQPTVDIIESYVYTLFSIKTGLTTLPQDALRIIGANLAKYALEIPDETLSKKFIMAFGIRVTMNILKDNKWDDAHSGSYAIRYEKRKNKTIKKLKTYSGPISIYGVDLPDPISVTEDQLKEIASKVNQLFNESADNYYKVRNIFKNIFHWVYSIPDDKLFEAFMHLIGYNIKNQNFHKDEIWIWFTPVINERLNLIKCTIEKV